MENIHRRECRLGFSDIRRISAERKRSYQIIFILASRFHLTTLSSQYRISLCSHCYFLLFKLTVSSLCSMWWLILKGDYARLQKSPLRGCHNALNASSLAVCGGWGTHLKRHAYRKWCFYIMRIQFHLFRRDWGTSTGFISFKKYVLRSSYMPGSGLGVEVGVRYRRPLSSRRWAFCETVGENLNSKQYIKYHSKNFNVLIGANVGPCFDKLERVGYTKGSLDVFISSSAENP